MKRYRLIPSDFDGRYAVLQFIERDDLNEHMKGHLDQVTEHLSAQYGPMDFDQKLENFRAIGPAPISIIAYHNRFYSAIRGSFVIGAYYPALTGACALGERILNHLWKEFSTDHPVDSGYRKFIGKLGMQTWLPQINHLHRWGILVDEAAKALKELYRERQEAIHVRFEVETEDKARALKAIGLIRDVVNAQFCGFGKNPWFITEIAGEIYLKKEWEAHPFIQRVYVPQTTYLGPKHACVSMMPLQYQDQAYPEIEISDEEWVRQRKAALGRL